MLRYLEEPPWRGLATAGARRDASSHNERRFCIGLSYKKGSRLVERLPSLRTLATPGALTLCPRVRVPTARRSNTVNGSSTSDGKANFVCPANGRELLAMSGAMRMQPAAPALRTINSETNLAVQLLAALRASPAPPLAAPSPSADRHSLTDDDDDRTAVASDASGSTAGSPLLGRAAAASGTTTPSGDERSSPATSGSSTETTLYKYSRAERQEALRRFKEKKRLRTFKKTIRYDVRKRLADTRPRYKGRFSKPPPGEHYDDGTPGPLS